MKIGAVIVAAGVPEQTDHDFQWIEDSELSMAERVVLNFQRAGVKELVVVTGYQGRLIEKSLKHYGISFLRNENYEKTEMFESIRLGLGYLRNRCDRILVCPADVPFFTEDTAEKLIKAKRKIVIPVHSGKAGHPICFDSDLVPKILDYQGKGGLRGAIDTLPVKPMILQIDDEGAVTDAYKGKDYQHLVEIHDSRLMRFQVEVKLVNKKIFFDAGIMNLLRLIDHVGSVKEACDKAGISYSKGWEMIHLAEKELGYEIVDRRQGGKFGGQAFITARGFALIENFERFETEVTKNAELLYKKIFGYDEV